METIMLQPIKVLWQYIKNENFNQMLVIGKRIHTFHLMLLFLQMKSKFYFYFIYFNFDVILIFILYSFQLKSKQTNKQSNNKFTSLNKIQTKNNPQLQHFNTRYFSTNQEMKLNN